MKETCQRCNKETIRIDDTVCGKLCEKCIREIREYLSWSLASIHCKGKERREQKRSD